jgi:hypothetical protein
MKVYFLGSKELDKSDEKNLLQLEIIWLIKILVALGYWEEGKYDQFENSVYVELKDESRRAQITEEINKAIRSTHL